jgi:hypothetical protein
MANIDPQDSEAVAKYFGIAEAMAAELMYWNDEFGDWNELAENRWERGTPESRFASMRQLVSDAIDVSVSMEVDP